MTRIKPPYLSLEVGLPGSITDACQDVLGGVGQLLSDHHTLMSPTDRATSTSFRIVELHFGSSSLRRPPSPTVPKSCTGQPAMDSN